MNNLKIFSRWEGVIWNEEKESRGGDRRVEGLEGRFYWYGKILKEVSSSYGVFGKGFEVRVFLEGLRNFEVRLSRGTV